MLEMAKIQFSAFWEVFDSQTSAKMSCVFSGSQTGHCSKFFCVLCLRWHKFNSVLPWRFLIVKRVPKNLPIQLLAKWPLLKIFLCAMFEKAQIQFSVSSEVFDSQKGAKKNCVFSGLQSGQSSKFFCVLCLRRHKFNSVLPQRCFIVKKVPKRAVCLVACKVATA